MASRTLSPTNFAVVAFLSGAVLAVVTAAAVPDLWIYWLAFLFLAVLLLGSDVILGPHLDRIKVRLDVPPQLYVAADNDAGLVLENPGRPVSLRLKVDTSVELEEIPEVRSVAAATGETRVDLTLHPRRRGTGIIEAVWMEGRGPLGLMRFRRCLNLGKTLAVHPDLSAVSSEAIRFFSSRSLHQGVRLERHRGDGTEFDHLREYVPGFDIRSVDWKASARHAKLLCREHRAERNRLVLLAVDSGRLMIEPLEGLPRLDHAIHAALTLAFVSLHVGDWAGLLSFDDQLHQFCPPVKGRGAMGKLSETASRIEYSTRETNFTLSLSEVSRRQVRRALVVVMTDFVDSITAELMVENLTRVSRRHRVLFVAMQDPMLLNEASSRPGDLLSLHKAVVAHRLQGEREAVLRRLRRLGIHCISALPREITPRLIDRYLEFKRKEAF